MSSLITSERLWILFGFFAQFVFFLRFITQWIESEKKKRSVIPMTFWYLSIVGTVLIIIYSYHQRDIVFVVANVLSLAIYYRNIALVKKKPQSEDENEILAAK
jgi:lipid-A-disaccharide synthase-like uncharacterized protein